MAGEIFISYRRADLAWAKLLHDQLKAEGVEAWYDAQIGAGQDWRVATANALEASQIFVLLFTANAALSKDIAKELAAATLENKLIIPVRLENIQPKGAFLYELASRNWINAFEDTEAKLEELAKGLAQLVRTGTRDDSVLPFERKTGAKVRPPLARKPKTILALIAGAALVMAVVAGGLFWQHARPAAPPTQTQPAASRVAVLPFEMLGGNGDARTFADTISEQIVATLNDNQVQTVSREDAKTLRGADRDAGAAKLGVEFIVNGSVQSGAKGLHVTIHLDHVLTHATVWTASYDQQGLAASEFQSQIAADTVGIAQSAIRARRDDPAEMDDAALGLVLRKNTTAWTMTPASFLEQRDLARAIVARAPKYVSAYLNLSQISSEMMKYASPDEIGQLRADAAKAASQALALDPNNSEAYIALGMQVPNGQWAEREALYRRAMAATPNDLVLGLYLADELSAVGRLREALALYTRAQAHSPTAQPLYANLAVAQVETGHVDEGLSLINHAATVWPSSFVIWQARFYILANFGQVDAARAMLDAKQNIPGSLEAGTMARRAYLDALKPGTTAAKAAAAKAIHSAMAAGDINVNEGLQMIAKLGDLDGAFTLAGTLLQPNDARQGLSITRKFLFRSSAAGMRRDPRFMPLAAKVGLVATWEKTGKWPDFCAEPGLPYDCRTAARAATSAK
jgi:TolB-like protein/Flp pilus assembly protein TadD